MLLQPSNYQRRNGGCRAATAATAPAPSAAATTTYGQHVACAVLATPATGGSIPDAEASAFLDAVNGLAGSTGKS